ncbi:MAG: bifunctional phosphoglucose/phosphomannose isomerase [Bacteroidota bacterium]
MNEQHIALSKFSYQIDFALSNYHSHGLNANNFNNLVIGGLGGSGIGGRIVKSLFVNEFPIPVECIADYILPNYVNEKTLVILASYSGNTEETLTMYEEVKKKNCTTLILTSGGKLKELATNDNLTIYEIESGFQPRMALGFSLTYLIQIFGELIQKEVKTELQKVVERVKDTQPYQDDAQNVFNSIKTKLTKKLIVLTDGLLEPVGIRFCQQIQENAKHECFNHVLPEMNHNVIESYYGQMESIFFFIHKNDNSRVTSRFDFMNNLLEVENNKIVPVMLDEIAITTVYDTIFTLDWLSLFIADFRRVDSLNVPNIMSLKEFLSAI